MITYLNKPRYNSCTLAKILIIFIMMLVNINLTFNIFQIHEDGVETDRMTAFSFMSLTAAVSSYTSDLVSDDALSFISKGIEYIRENIWFGPKLTKSRGTITGPSGKETYYNLNMSVVVRNMRRLGYDYEYWVRDDGVKMFGKYVMVAANLKLRPRGSLVKTSLGMGIVCDTGGFAKKNPTQIDIATTW